MVKIALPQKKRKISYGQLFPEPDLRAELDPMLNEGQKSALLLMLRFINNIDQNMFVLKGYAGTGKSFLINRFIKEAIKTVHHQSIAITAPTNKAVKVLKAISDRSLSIHYLTIHSLLGLTQKIDNKGRISFAADKKSKQSIGNIRLLIVDETSMLDDHLFNLLEQAVETQKGRLRIIFVGDYAQIPPVGKENSIPFTRGLSSGYSEEGYTLRQIMRQKNENPIVSAAYNIRENLSNPYITSNLTTSIKGGTGLRIINKGIDLTNLYVALFATTAFSLNANHAKVIAWTNAEVKAHNNAIRNIIFRRPLQKIVVGDKLIANTSISSGKELLYNASDEFEVINSSVREDRHRVLEKDVIIKVYLTAVVESTYAAKQQVLKILHEDSYEEFDRTLERLKERAVSTSYTPHWVEYYDFLKIVADVSYNYAITAHKAQGSTYENVIVIEDDINKNRNVVERNRIKYTAYTRASKQLIIYRK